MSDGVYCFDLDQSSLSPFSKTAASNPNGPRTDVAIAVTATVAAASATRSPKDFEQWQLQTVGF
jgi:hypothetical protein